LFSMAAVSNAFGRARISSMPSIGQRLLTARLKAVPSRHIHKLWHF